MLALFTSLFLSLSLEAAPRFESLRSDVYVPKQCKNVNLQHFNQSYNIVIYGIEGAKNHGFSHEFPISRHEARSLWLALYENDSKSRKQVYANAKLLNYFEALISIGLKMGFDYSKEGDVLEALVLIDLEHLYPESDFYHTGGIEYGDTEGKYLMGEIDILVARRSDCSVVAIGEAKLGYRGLKKAKEQVRRIDNFIDSYL